VSTGFIVFFAFKDITSASFIQDVCNMSALPWCAPDLWNVQPFWVI